MTTVFLSGSRKISRLNDAIRGRIQGIVDQGFRVVVGDANGADRAMQKYLAEQGYRNVTVYYAGGTCRNNAGGWEAIPVVDAKLKGRALYTKRDEVMASKADYGFVLWDGKSKGSFKNVLELCKKKAKAKVYFRPDKKFLDVKSKEDIQKHFGAEALEMLEKQTNTRKPTEVSGIAAQMRLI